MILYYSGTGNSRHAAKRIADALGEPLCDLNGRIKAGDTSPLDTGERIVIVTPTYAWRIPRIVRSHLEKTELRGAKWAWFVMTCGGDIGDADKYNRSLCEEKRITCMGTAQIVMPENYIAMFDAPQPEKARQIVADAEPVIDRAAADIAKYRPFAPARRSFRDRLLSGPVNPFFYRTIVRADAFTVSDACIGCGKCAALCPTNTIELVGGKPVWGAGCTHCMACICHCPVEAIEYGKKSLGKPRYHLD